MRRRTFHLRSQFSDRNYACSPHSGRRISTRQRLLSLLSPSISTASSSPLPLPETTTLLQRHCKRNMQTNYVERIHNMQWVRWYAGLPKSPSTHQGHRKISETLSTILGPIQGHRSTTRNIELSTRTTTCRRILLCSPGVPRQTVTQICSQRP